MKETLNFGLGDTLMAAARLRGLCLGELVLWGVQSVTTQVGLDLYMWVAAQVGTLVMNALAVLNRQGIGSTRSMSQESTE